MISTKQPSGHPAIDRPRTSKAHLGTYMASPVKPSKSPINSSKRPSKVVIRPLNSDPTPVPDSNTPVHLKRITSLEKLISQVSPNFEGQKLPKRNTSDLPKGFFASTRHLHGRVLFAKESESNDRKRKMSSHDVTTVDTRTGSKSKVDANQSWGIELAKLPEVEESEMLQERKKTHDSLLRITAPHRFGARFLKSSSRASLGPISSQSLGSHPFVRFIDSG